MSFQHAFNDEERERYSRHFSLPGIGIAGQKKLKESKVLVVGAGGLGSPVLLYLAAAGVGTIGIVDADKVELSNLQRQMIYTGSDIGSHKVGAAKSRLKSLNSNLEVLEYPVLLDERNALGLVSDYDIVIDGTDNLDTRYVINDACVILGKVMIYGSVYQFEGHMAVLNYKGSPNYRDLYPVPPPPELTPDCAQGGILGVLPGIIGNLQVLEALKIITETGTVQAGKQLIFDGLSMSFRWLRIQRIENNTREAIVKDWELKKTKKMDVKEITVTKLKDMKDKGEKFQLIDVRESNEYEFANIGGELIPLGEIEENKDKISKELPVVIQCRSGKRSADAVMKLQKHGFTNLYNLKGGILAWSEEIDPSIPKY